MAISIDETLDLLSFASAEMVNGNANHGPMAAEALFAMDREDAVVPWIDGYRGRLKYRPSPVAVHSTRGLEGIPGRPGTAWRLDCAVRERIVRISLATGGSAMGAPLGACGHGRGHSRPHPHRPLSPQSFPR